MVVLEKPLFCKIVDLQAFQMQKTKFKFLNILISLNSNGNPKNFLINKVRRRTSCLQAYQLCFAYLHCQKFFV